MVRVADRTVVVTGATSGIGRETARAMAAEGARVLLLARTESDLRAVADDVETAGGEAGVYPVDLSEHERVAAVADRIRDREATPAVLVNAAGAGSWRSILEADPGDAARCMGVPYLGAFELAREFLPAMLRAGRGRVANVESPGGYVAFPGATAYTAARFAMRGLTESLWVELQATPVGVTRVVPGVVDTDYFRRNDNLRERLPPGADRRSVDPGEVAVELVAAVKDDRQSVYVPPDARLLVETGRHAPGLARRLLRYVGWQPDPDDWA